VYPMQTHELARLKIADELAYAARQRLVRAASKDRPRAIDFSSLGQKLRVRLFGGSALGAKPAGAGA
jgi:hypothetical protein